MSYQLGACVSPFPYAQCEYQSVTLNRFDADHDALGILESVSASPGWRAEEEVTASTSTMGASRVERAGLLLSKDELDAGVSAGCYRRFFEPSDAICVIDAGLPSDCTSGCTNGRWTSPARPDCLFNYDNVKLGLTAESCRSAVNTRKK